MCGLPSNMKSSSHKMWQATLIFLKPLQIQNPKRKSGGTWHIMSPPVWKSEGDTSPVSPTKLRPRAMHFMGRSMDCTLEDNMVDGLFFCATLTGCRRGHTPFVQAGAETSNTGAEAVEPGPASSWKGHSAGWVPVSGMKMRSLVGLYNHSAFHWWSAHCAAHRLLLSDELMRCCGAGTNGCLDLRRRAFALDGQVSAGWSRCPGPMTRSARDSVAPFRWSSAG